MKIYGYDMFIYNMYYYYIYCVFHLQPSSGGEVSGSGDDYVPQRPDSSDSDSEMEVDGAGDAPIASTSSGRGCS